MAITTEPDDPQTNQIKQIIKDYAGDGKIRVLDFGAGKGRLLSALLADENIETLTIPNCLDYYAYDITDTNKEECKQVIESIYGTDTNRYFNEMSSLREKCDDESFDFIIMCNVLHEIGPNDWIELFNSNGVVYKLLKQDGYLLVVEDQLIPYGEKAHSKGFLVFNTHQIKKLFGISEAEPDVYSCQDARGDGRLKAHLIKRNVLQRINFETKCDAISSLRDTAKEEIYRLRSMEPSTINGRLHGFWTQQFANAELALDEAGK